MSVKRHPSQAQNTVTSFPKQEPVSSDKASASVPVEIPARWQDPEKTPVRPIDSPVAEMRATESAPTVTSAPKFEPILSSTNPPDTSQNALFPSTADKMRASRRDATPTKYETVVINAPVALDLAEPPPQSKEVAPPKGLPVRPYVPESVEFVKSGARGKRRTGALTVTVDDLNTGLYVGSDQQTMPYRYFVPNIASNSARVPLVLFLHGLGEAGSDNRKQLARQPAPLVFVQPLAQQRYPCFFLAPQHRPGGVWGGGCPEEPSANLAMAVAILDQLIAKYPGIDPDRLYVTGLSSGGIGAWDALAKFPYKFAGAVPISSGWDPKSLRQKQGVAVWAFYKEHDSDFIATYCKAMLEGLVHRGGIARVTAYAGKDHDAWTLAYGEPDLIPWLFSQKRYVPFQY